VSVGAGRRRRAGVLRRTDFRLLLAGQTLSAFGDSVAAVAMAFGILMISGSATALGAVLAARFIPAAALLLISGTVADRGSRRRLMIRSDVVRAGAQLGTAALFLSGTIHLWPILALQVIYGGAEAFFTPAMTGLVPAVVPAQDLRVANAALHAGYDLSIVAGPALGGLLLALTGPAVVLSADAATFAVSAVLLACLRAPDPRISAPPRSAGLGAEIKAGWTVVRRRRWLWSSMGATVVFSALSFPAFLVLGPQLARSELGGVGTWSRLIAACGAGALVGSIASLRIRVSRPAAAVAVLVAISAVLPAALASGLGTPGVLTLAFASGAAMSTAGVLWTTMIQRHVPSDALSRVEAIDNFGAFLLTPIGYLMAGPIAGAVGLHRSLTLLTLIPALASLATLLVPEIRDLGRLEPDHHRINPQGPLGNRGVVDTSGQLVTQSNATSFPSLAPA
jgi:MFS family permease